MIWKNNRAPLLNYIKLCASFQSHGWIQTGVTVQKLSIRVKIGNFLFHVTLKFDGWPWKKRAPLQSNIKLCASFHRHMWIQTGVMVRKGLNGFMTSVTLTFDLWPWPFAWTSRLSMVITPENFRMIQWQEHCQKGVMGGQTDRQTERSVIRAAWSQLKRVWKCYLWHGGHFVSDSICSKRINQWLST